MSTPTTTVSLPFASPSQQLDQLDRDRRDPTDLGALKNHMSSWYQASPGGKANPQVIKVGWNISWSKSSKCHGPPRHKSWLTYHKYPDQIVSWGVMFSLVIWRFAIRQWLMNNWFTHFQIVIFHSYVCLPEGIHQNLNQLTFFGGRPVETLIWMLMSVRVSFFMEEYIYE